MTDPSSSTPTDLRLVPTTGRSRAWGVAVCSCLVLSGLLPTPSRAQAPAALDSLGALHLPNETEVRLDGLASEPFWSEAPVLSELWQKEPLEGVVPSERTEVRVAYDETSLFVSIVAYDRQPDQIVARIRQRDRVMSSRGFGLSFQGDDAVAFILDPFLDRRSGILFATNPNGAQFDALVTDEGGEINADWRGVWEVAATRTLDGWSAEFAIPWRTLRYPADASRGWGFNVARVIQRENEQLLWRSWEREGGGFERMSRAGRLTGLEGLPRPGMNVEVKPYALGGLRWTRPGETTALDRDASGDVGIDLKSEVRPGLVLDLTANTDFAQVEVDDQQVNLTRFSLFFPEKREFFLENAGLFEFGQSGFFGPPPFLAFFSRNIGIGSGGEVPILGGGRLTGRVGDQTVGLLSVATGQAGDAGREIFNVARLKRDVGESNYIGAMLTDRRGEGDANTVVGFDTRVVIRPTLITDGFVARTFTEGAGGEGTAAAGSINYTTDLWGVFLRVIQVGEGARARSGFIARTDFRSTWVNLRRSVRPNLLGIRKMDLRVNGQYDATVDGRFQGRQVGLSLGSNWDTGDSFTVNVNQGAEQIDGDFVLADSLDVPAGRYDTGQWSLRGSTGGRRAWALSANMTGGDFFGGDLLRFGGSLSLAPTPSLGITAGFDRNDVDLPSGSFTADVTSLRFTWSLNTRVTTNALVQYNGLTDEILTNVRLNVIHRPGSDIFVVLTEDRLRDGADWFTEDRGFVVKLTYLLRF
jgi:hypothetical protein